MAKVIDHGSWVEYTPEVYSETMPVGPAYLRRVSDGHDWYAYVNVVEGNRHHIGRTKRFSPNTVKCVIDGDIIRTAAVDETRLFPKDGHLIELIHVFRSQNEDGLIKEFCNRHIDIKTGEIGELPKPPENKLGKVLDAILDRLDKLEKKS